MIVLFLRPGCRLDTGLLQDEGPLGVLRIGWNLLTNAKLRDRFVATRRVLEDNETAIGYIILHAMAIQKQ
jgi:hypothetical protein